MAARKVAQNSYLTMSGGVVAHNHDGQVKRPKTHILAQINRLEYHVLSAFFGGIKGKFLLDGIKYAMVAELDACTHELSDWREVAQMVQGRVDFIYH